MSFDATQFIKTQNEKEQAARTGAPAPKVEEAAPPVAVAVAEPEDPEEKQEQEHARLPRSARRAITQRDREIGRLQGMLEAYQKIGTKPAEETKLAEPKIDPDAKPDRANYATDAEHSEAIATWAARQEVKKSESQQQWQQRITQMAEKAAEDAKLIPDWEAHAKAAEADGPEFTPAEHPNLMALLATSEYQALAMDYFATHPDELEEMLALSPKPAEQIVEFRALEGHLKRVYRTLTVKPPEQKKEPEKPVPVKLPKPSESVATRSGSAPVQDIAPYLADGKTINPAWKEQRNQREGARR